ncbi:hypothetical protein D3C84_395460 [compost metagenome]
MMMVLFRFLPTVLMNSSISAFLKLAAYSVAQAEPAIIKAAATVARRQPFPLFIILGATPIHYSDKPTYTS